MLKLLSKTTKFYYLYLTKVEGENDRIRLCEIIKSLMETVGDIGPVIDEIQVFASDYDLDENTPGNGYRSFVYIVEKAAEKTMKAVESVKEKRGKVFFRKGFHEKEVAAYNELLQSLLIIGRTLIENNQISKGTQCMFSDVGNYENTIRRTMNQLNLTSFYGRAFLFHLPKSIRKPLRHSSIFMAMYSEYYYSTDYVIMKILRLPGTYFKYFLNDNLLSQRIVDLYENFESDFAKSFSSFFDSKMFGAYQHLTEHKVDVNEVILVPTEPMQLYSAKYKKQIEIPVPSSHIDKNVICCRLFSARYRKGMKANKVKDAEKSKSLIIFCHGGGWIMYNSKIHGSFLKEWAANLDVPILSIDYSLAPKAPFPRALEEVFYAYCWALKNPELVGWTGENVVLVGDSAGGNLATACVIKCIEMGIQKPNGLFNIYAVFMSDYAMAPSRYLGLMDVSLPYSPNMQIFEFYNGHDKKSTITANRKVPRKLAAKKYTLPQSYLFSCHLTPDEIIEEFPKTAILSTNFDSCLDECLEFAKKLKARNVDVKLDILDGLNHGFLNMTRISKESQQGSELCMTRIRELLNQT